MFVFGEVQEPLPETVKLVEDVVRGQIIEIVRPFYLSLPLMENVELMLALALACLRSLELGS